MKGAGPANVGGVGRDRSSSMLPGSRVPTSGQGYLRTSPIGHLSEITTIGLVGGIGIAVRPGRCQRRHGTPYGEHWLIPQRNGGAICTRGRQAGHVVRDVVRAAHPVSNFVGGIPDVWTRWVIDVLGYQSGAEVKICTRGSGAIQRAAAMVL